MAQHHQTGPDVSTVTSLPGTMWLEVEICVSNDVSQSSIRGEDRIAVSTRTCKGNGREPAKDEPTSHSRPVVVICAVASPSGRMPHVGPRMAWSMAISCLPWSNQALAFKLARRSRKTSQRRAGRTVSRHQATSSSLTTQTRARLVRSRWMYDSVWTVWSSRPVRPPMSTRSNYNIEVRKSRVQVRHAGRC
jgi:hypothetical protein